MDSATTRLGVRVNAVLCGIGIAPTALLLFLSEGFDVRAGLILALFGSLALIAILHRRAGEIRPRVDRLANVGNAAVITGLGTVMASSGWDLILGLYAGCTLLLIVTALIDRCGDDDGVALTSR